MKHESQLKALLTHDPVRMKILRIARDLNLPDCWIAAGFVRSLVWDHLHQRKPSALPDDIDVIWYDPAHADTPTDSALDRKLSGLCSEVNWSVKNQARMHLRNADVPYRSAADAMTCWPETATAVAVRLDHRDEIEVLAPLGLEDLFSRVVRPTERFRTEKHAMFLERIRVKGWRETWPDLIVVTDR
ncbi:nucleotidyltransferase family protein [Pseudomonas sp. AKS31]|uniref:nucleotidyltransferase family protein n=1 Tax=Pseudomonas sp. AKS31 TaxID=2949091 RepID=UPI002029F843|nr:nucleotidyltransferase family protein [Pseudomonas sp. AKS31]MCL9799944.1 nucleotidyltransferase family protein [Pseudomonas sp. AKS31]